MSEHVLIPLPGLGTLSLPREVFEQHLLSPSTTPTVPSSELVDADELQARTGIPASWWMAQARERRVPFRKLGRYVRFDVRGLRADRVHTSFATGDPMSQDAFKPSAYLKVGCPFSFKFLLFVSEAHLLDSIEIVRCDPERPEFEEIKIKLEQATHAKASFPTVEVEPGVYKTDSDKLIEYYARRTGVADQTLPALAFYKESIFPQLLESHQ